MAYHRYFVSYVQVEGASTSYGNLEHRTNKPITSIDEVQALATLIENDFGYEESSVIVLNYQKFQEG